MDPKEPETSSRSSSELSEPDESRRPRKVKQQKQNADSEPTSKKSSNIPESLTIEPIIKSSGRFLLFLKNLAVTILTPILLIQETTVATDTPHHAEVLGTAGTKKWTVGEVWDLYVFSCTYRIFHSNSCSQHVVIASFLVSGR
jgi:hypothetical protein